MSLSNFSLTRSLLLDILRGKYVNFVVVVSWPNEFE
mgnify:CR=1 FL=1